MKKGSILTCEIHSLGFSEAFCKACKKLEVKKLSEILSQERSALIKKPGFSYHWLAELVSFLEKEEMGHLLHTQATERTSG